MSCFHLSHPSVHWRPLRWTPTQICSKVYFRIVLPCWPELSNVVATVFRVNVKPAQVSRFNFYCWLIATAQGQWGQQVTQDMFRVNEAVLCCLLWWQECPWHWFQFTTPKKRHPVNPVGRDFPLVVTIVDEFGWQWPLRAFVSVAPWAKLQRGRPGVRGVSF